MLTDPRSLPWQAEGRCFSEDLFLLTEGLHLTPEFAQFLLLLTVVSPSRSPESISSWFTQFRRVPSETPISRAIPGIGCSSPEALTSRIASRRNSGGYAGFVRGNALLSAHCSQSETVHETDASPDPSYTTPKLSAEMLELMTNTSFEDRLPQPLPEGTRVAHKIGSYGDTFSDAGVVFPQGSRGAKDAYFIVVIAKDATEGTTRSGIQDMSVATYRLLGKPLTRPKAKFKPDA